MTSELTADPTVHAAEHGTIVQAPAGVVYDIVRDVLSWPHIFGPTVFVDRVDKTGVDEERIRIWATANDQVKGWTSHRVLDPRRRRIAFRQEVSQPPVAAMSGEWILEPLSESSTRVRLTHTFRAVGDDPEKVEWIRRAIDRNSDAELAALKDAAERRDELNELRMTFADDVAVAGAADDVFRFLYEAGRWAERLPHVARVALTEETPNVQLLEMDTLTADGSTHTTRSARVCFPNEMIVYKQLLTPALLTAHTGRWTVRTTPSGARVTSEHTVVIRPSAVTEVLGPGKTVADARAFVRNALGRNSTATMMQAKTYAESALRA
ncbi:aromatase/cyclase [Micromonospora ureilytica]|uniref:aromatase/cyclase n=1 Tax=Micromonospora ureilytica TaxID=709868 RepID=UPI0033DF6390